MRSVAATPIFFSRILGFTIRLRIAIFVSRLIFVRQVRIRNKELAVSVHLNEKGFVSRETRSQGNIISAYLQEAESLREKKILKHKI